MRKQLLGACALAGVLVATPLTALADCASPASPAGRIEYTSGANGNVFKYCDGTDWVPWAGEPVTGVPAPQFSSSSALWTVGAADDIYYNKGSAPMVGIGTTNPDVALDVIGDINYTGVLVDVSDIRLKGNVRPLHNPLDRLTSLNGFSFEMKGDPKHQIEYGVSAQDVQRVFPELVHPISDDGTLGVSYTGLIAPMIEAIKELKAENASLKSRIEALERQERGTTE